MEKLVVCFDLSGGYGWAVAQWSCKSKGLATRWFQRKMFFFFKSSLWDLFHFSLTCNSFLPNGPSTLTNYSWVLLHIDQRPLHVWWHRVMSWCIFHMAFLRHNSTHTGIKISIIHTRIQWYLTYLFSNICSQLSSEDAFDTHFSVAAGAKWLSYLHY